MAVGATVLDSSQHSVEDQHAENELALLGSKVSETGLGDADVQSAIFSSENGEYEVRTGEEVGTMKIEHVDRPEELDKELADVELGAVVYTNGDTEKAFQGGGVWSGTGESTTMVSPPEFHYRSGTLTLPMIIVEGDSSATGKSTAVVKPSSDTRRIYPAGENHQNPIEDGVIRVTVQGDYYKGWEQYFKERTSGDVNIDHGEKKVSVDLVTLGDRGEIDLTDDGKINLIGYEDGVNDFEMTLVGKTDSPSHGLNNLNWELKLNEEKFIKLKSQGHGNRLVDVTVYEKDGEDFNKWENVDPVKREEEDVHTLNIDMLSDVEMEHDGDTKKLGELINERLEESAPEAVLEIDDQGKQSRLDYDESIANIEYEGDGNYITFLQITENKVEVEVS